MLLFHYKTDRGLCMMQNWKLIKITSTLTDYQIPIHRLSVDSWNGLYLSLSLSLCKNTLFRPRNLCHTTRNWTSHLFLTLRNKRCVLFLILRSFCRRFLVEGMGLGLWSVGTKWQVIVLSIPVWFVCYASFIEINLSLCWSLLLKHQFLFPKH